MQTQRDPVTVFRNSGISKKRHTMSICVRRQTDKRTARWRRLLTRNIHMTICARDNMHLFWIVGASTADLFGGFAMTILLYTTTIYCNITTTSSLIPVNGGTTPKSPTSSTPASPNRPKHPPAISTPFPSTHRRYTLSYSILQPSGIQSEYVCYTIPYIFNCISDFSTLSPT